MRIVSDFHDYYDVVQATGQDQTVVYLRTRTEVELHRDSFPFPILGGTPPRYEFRPRGVPNLQIVQMVAGFCGKVYPILQLSHQRLSEPRPNIALCYRLSEVDAFVENRFKQREIEIYRLKLRGRREYWPVKQRREKFEEFFDIYATKQSAFGRLFLENRCPIFVASTWWGTDKGCREYKIVYNECLKELEFFRLIDTYTAYQELQMYFGAMAQPNKPIPQVSDKDMISIKGFDKWSFRKPPKSFG
ncbi:MAG: hypothetical protein ACLQNE_33465 [Thermoguttaceae bacterium]